MLDATLGRLERSQRPLQPLNRLLLIGAATPGVDGPQLTEWHEKQVNAVKAIVMDMEKVPGGEASDTSSSITGLLLSLPTGWIHMVEASLSTLTELLTAIKQGADTGVLTNVKVVSAMEDINNRTFSFWSHKQLDVGRGNYEEVTEAELPGLLANTTIGMLKLGKVISPLSRPEAATKLAAWNPTFADFIPSNERVGQLLGTDEVPRLQDFLETYVDPVGLSLSEDKVWPPDRPMVY